MRESISPTEVEETFGILGNFSPAVTWVLWIAREEESATKGDFMVFYNEIGHLKRGEE